MSRLHDLAPGQTTVLFGPNGAGKTTLLRRLAGMGGEEGGLDRSYLPQRPYHFRGMAGRDLGLGLHAEEAAHAAQLAESLGVGDLLLDTVDRLSGGERQRLALARALARRARWVLLDEPLTGIDLLDRNRVVSVLSDALRHRSAVVVTHDLELAVALGHRLAVIDRGVVIQEGPLPEVLRAPANAEAARILGVANVVEGIASTDGGITTVRAGLVEVQGRGEVTGPARALIPAEAITLASAAGSARNHWEGTVMAVGWRGRMVEVTLDVGVPLVALVTPGAATELGVEPGRTVTVSVKAAAVTVVPA